VIEVLRKRDASAVCSMGITEILRTENSICNCVVKPLIKEIGFLIFQREYVNKRVALLCLKLTISFLSTDLSIQLRNLL
jgi:hypothetical protein